MPNRNNRCCCGCVIFSDTFNRADGDVDNGWEHSDVTIANIELSYPGQPMSSGLIERDSLNAEVLDVRIKFDSVVTETIFIQFGGARVYFRNFTGSGTNNISVSSVGSANSASFNFANDTYYDVKICFFNLDGVGIRDIATVTIDGNYVLTIKSDELSFSLLLRIQGSLTGNQDVFTIDDLYLKKSIDSGATCEECEPNDTSGSCFSCLNNDIDTYPFAGGLIVDVPAGSITNGTCDQCLNIFGNLIIADRETGAGSGCYWNFQTLPCDWKCASDTEEFFTRQKEMDLRVSLEPDANHSPLGSKCKWRVSVGRFGGGFLGCDLQNINVESTVWESALLDTEVTKTTFPIVCTLVTHEKQNTWLPDSCETTVTITGPVTGTPPGPGI